MAPLNKVFLAGTFMLLPACASVMPAPVDFRNGERPATVALAPLAPPTINTPSAPLEPKAPHLWPLADGVGQVISPFGAVRDHGGRARTHRGIDIKATMKTPVVATASGRVVVAGKMRGYGKVVMIDHPAGFRTVYGHLNKIRVTPGQRLNAGDILGALGSTGNSTTPHVHYEVQRNACPLDPAAYLPAR